MDTADAIVVAGAYQQREVACRPVGSSRRISESLGRQIKSTGHVSWRELFVARRIRDLRYSSGKEFAMATHGNTVEGAFSLLKRGIYGTFHNVSSKHLHPYVPEGRGIFDCSFSKSA
jgi:hypothetical protein